tara:strand:+ start:484 stop:702 length:219 start_codon:yes stop_codon:yes gene_type:complete
VGATAAYAGCQTERGESYKYRCDKGHQMNNVILHCVFCSFHKDVIAEQRTEVFAGLRPLAKQLMASLGLILV